MIDSVDNDYNTKIYVGGRTLDSNTVLGQSGLTCFNSANFAGYITMMTSGSVTWSKYFMGTYQTAADNQVQLMPWVGISRSAQAHVREVYTDFVASYLQMTFNDFLIIMDGTTGALVNMQ